MARGFRLVSRGNGDLKTRYRPRTLKEVAPTAPVRRLKKILTDVNASQVYLFEGLTGAGKTTCARILARAAVCTADGDKPCLKCEPCTIMETCGDFFEMNVANQRGIDDMRELIDQMRTHPFYLDKKIYVLDEVHMLSPQAKQILLKALEEPPEHVLIFLCTTDAHKLNRMLIARTQQIKFKRVTKDYAHRIIDQVLEDEQLDPVSVTLKDDMYRRADGSVRDLLNLLQSYLDDDYEEGASEEDEASAGVKELASALMKRDWEATSGILKSPDVKKAPESLRIGVCNYLRAVCLNQESVSKAQFAAFPLGQLITELVGPPHLQYNQFVLQCLRACYKK